jgi:aminoglycoside N3'-acetyltransferase
VAYKLDLLVHSSIHPVFHVSQLEQVVGVGHEVTLVLPSNFGIKLAPEQVLDTRVILSGADRIQQVFIKWNNLPSSLAT